MKISPERWAQLEPHFDAVLDLDDAGCEAYLERLGAEDASLAADLKRLLHTRSTGGRWRDLPSEAPDLLSAAARWRGDPELADRQIGPYRVVRTIGRGGMSVVYLAERTDGKFDQQVAVKVMHWTGGARAVERFRLEQQTLARLDHPSITRIFDSGVTDDGLPYFVMEWIDGTPLTNAADERHLRVRERVRWFVRVCEAVHSAHQRLIVHRDLKPDNVLMTRDGHVKVLDFGIAKWLTEEESGQTALTRHGEGLLTPQYAAPEQHLDQPVTTATDVYALGLLLYELLAGRPPYELAGKSITEQRRLVCEADPEPLSARAQASRGRELRGDLETICAKALQKEPGRRYDSAAAMADDLRRFLDGHAVQAAPNSAAYRASRFVRRHRISVTIAAVATLGLMVAAGVTAWQAGVAGRERDNARAEAARTQRIVDFMVGSLEQANPYADNGGAVTVQEFLERSVARIEEELADQPDVRVRIYTTMARVFSHTGEARRGEAFADRAIRLADSLYGVTSVESATARYEKARALSASNLDSSRALQVETIAMLEGQRSRDARKMLADLLEDYGNNLVDITQYDSALVVEQRALSIREALYDGPHSDLARSHHHLATVLSSQGNPQAGAEFARAARLWKQTLGPNHPNYASTLNNWAIWLENNGQPDSAETLYEQTLEINRRVLGRSEGLATQLNNIGRLALDRGRLDEANAYLTEAADILRGIDGSDLPLAATLTNLGLAAFLSGDYETAAARYLEGRSVFKRRFGPDHSYVAIADSYVGRALWKLGKTAEADRRLRRAITVLEKNQPAMASRLVSARTWYGRMIMETDPAAGEALLRSATDLAADQLTNQSPERGEAEVALGICLMRRHATEEGELRLRSGYERLLAEHGKDHPLTQWAMAALESPGRL